ncbi:MAG: hypothetical protein Tsb005_04350 [Gammaproteobacteria bacterium]
MACNLSFFKPKSNNIEDDNFAILPPGQNSLELTALSRGVSNTTNTASSTQRKHSYAYYISFSFYLFTIFIATVLAYGIPARKYDEEHPDISPILKTLFIFSVVTLNALANIFYSTRAWYHYAHMFTDVHIRARTKVGHFLLALLLAVPQLAIYLSAAVGEVRDDLAKSPDDISAVLVNASLLLPSSLISSAPLLIYSSLLTVDEVIAPWLAHPSFNNNRYNWPATHRLFMQLIAELRLMQYNEKINLLDRYTHDAFALVINTDFKLSSRPIPRTLLLLTIILSVFCGLALMNGLNAFGCATEATFDHSPRRNNVGVWALTLLIMSPLFYFALNKGYSTARNLLRAPWQPIPQSALPYALRKLPAVISMISSLFLVLAAFSFTFSAQVLADLCPTVMAAFLVQLAKFVVPFYNGWFSLSLVFDAGEQYIAKRGIQQQKNIIKHAHSIEKLITNLNKMTYQNFAETLHADSGQGAELINFLKSKEFADPDKIEGYYQQSKQELADGGRKVSANWRNNRFCQFFSDRLSCLERYQRVEADEINSEENEILNVI